MSLLGGAVANDALMTSLSNVKRLFALIILPFCLMSAHLEPQGGRLPPTKYVYVCSQLIQPHTHQDEINSAYILKVKVPRIDL